MSEAPDDDHSDLPLAEAYAVSVCPHGSVWLVLHDGEGKPIAAASMLPDTAIRLVAALTGAIVGASVILAMADDDEEAADADGAAAADAPPAGGLH